LVRHVPSRVAHVPLRQREFCQHTGVGGGSRNALDIPHAAQLRREEHGIVVSFPTAHPTLSVFVSELSAFAAVSPRHAYVRVGASVALIRDPTAITRPDRIAAAIPLECKLGQRSVGTL